MIEHRQRKSGNRDNCHWSSPIRTCCVCLLISAPAVSIYQKPYVEMNFLIVLKL